LGNIQAVPVQNNTNTPSPPLPQEGDSHIERMGVLIGTFEKKVGLYFPLPFSESDKH